MSTIMNERPRQRRSLSLDRFSTRSGFSEQKSPTCAGASHHHSNSTPSARPPPQRRSSSRRSSFSQSTSFIWSGQAPSSFIEPEARPSNTLSRQDSHTTCSSATSQRDSLFSLGRISIVSNPRPSLPHRPTSSASARQEFGENNKPWSSKSALKRISWGWNQTFAGLTPQEITEVEFERGRGREVNIPRTPQYQHHRQRSSSESRPSTAHSTNSNTSARSDASTIIPAGSSLTTVNKPFANRRPSVARAPPVALPPVTEEESHPEGTEETDEMGLGRSITKRFQRINGGAPEKARPVIGLPSLISTTNSQVTDAYEVHPALRNSGSSQDYNITCPATPNSETPGLTDSSSVGSSRSSAHGSPIEGHFNGVIEPNHLTQYFPQLAPEKVCDNVVIRANSISEDDVFISGPAPALPTRAASHSKREHERLAKSRSLRSSTGSYSSRHTSASAGETQAFANGLTQVEEVQEVQEEFNGMTLETTVTNDEKVMNQGFRSFTPSVYMLDLADMEATRWIDEAGRRSVTA